MVLATESTERTEIAGRVAATEAWSPRTTPLAYTNVVCQEERAGHGSYGSDGSGVWQGRGPREDDVFGSGLFRDEVSESNEVSDRDSLKQGL
jgi:hypothetical protein